jgi:ribosomal protein S12 methylthiotransferase accessory factor
VAGDRKRYHLGTHRVLAPGQTWRRLLPVLPLVGITRVAEVTWLDDLGVPVYQAVRPNARMLSVSQGKGLTPMAARVSAVMESIELWHAEHLDEHPVAVQDTVRAVSRLLSYRVDELPVAARHCLNLDTRLSWARAELLDGSGTSLVPVDSLRLDGRVDDRWSPPLFEPTSNGLASGNRPAEARAHGLYEVLERDSIAGTAWEDRPAVAVTPDAGWSGPVRRLLGRLRRAQIRIAVTLAPNQAVVPCFAARIWSEDYPVAFEGTGCHLDRDVALSRALTEAAQSRLTAISGVREDLRGQVYHHRLPTPPPQRERRTVQPQEIATTYLPDVADEVRLLAGRIARMTGRAPLAVDLTRADVAVAVVKVIAPGLRYPSDY